LPDPTIAFLVISLIDAGLYLLAYLVVRFLRREKNEE
jgi:hypothetical protein